MDKFGDKEYRGYTWEVTEEVRCTESRYIVNVVRVEEPGKYHYALNYSIPKVKLEDLGIPRDPQTGAPAEGWIKWEIDKYESGSDGFGIDEYNFGINKPNKLYSIKKDPTTLRRKFINILILLTVIQFFVADIGLRKLHINTDTFLMILGGVCLLEIIVIIYIRNNRVL